ncbi:MAG: 2-hydroxyacid dehydrogenase [Candidatus Thorarchaeota archaeon]
MKVLVPYTKELADTIQNTLGERATVVRSERTAGSMLEHADDAEVVASGRVPGGYIRNAKNLKMIQSLGAGIDKIDREAVLERGDIIVCNNHVNAVEVAEYAIMLLFAACKNIILNDRELRKGDWTYGWSGPNPNVEIRNKTCVIIGLGSVGTEVARRLRGFGVRIHAITKTGKSPQASLVDRIVGSRDTKEVIQDADFIILSLPLTIDSREMVDEEFIRWMKPSSILVNISRGEIIDEAALFDALKGKRIRGAALDVWWNYPQWGKAEMKPPSVNFPYHELDNLVLSPHRAAYSENIMRDQIRFVGENILRFINGETPLNIVDMRKGY